MTTSRDMFLAHFPAKFKYPGMVEDAMWDAWQAGQAAQKDELAACQAELAAIKMQEPVAYMFPSDLAKFQEQETFAQAYSVSVGNPSETTVPVFAGPAPIPADMVRVPEYTTGHCENHKHPKGCQLHNIQCGWPECDRRLIAASQEKKNG